MENMTFEISDEARKYILKISGPSGNATSVSDLYFFHNDVKFSTFDQDNDIYSGDCSNKFGGKVGWWFQSCYYVLLTGNYYFTNSHGEIMYTASKPEFAEMKFRRNV